MTVPGPRGLALGRATVSRLAEAGITVAGIRWVYSPETPRDEFPPHRELAGRFYDSVPVVNETLNSPAYTRKDGTKGNSWGTWQRWESGWFPGDHPGCGRPDDTGEVVCRSQAVLRGPDGRFVPDTLLNPN